MAIYPDVAAGQMDPFTHYLRHGQREYRLSPPSVHAKKSASKLRPGGRKRNLGQGASGPVDRNSVVAFFLSPAEGFAQTDDYVFTNLMAYLWMSRLDLQKIFDLDDPQGRFNFSLWFVMEARLEYSLSANVFPEDLLLRIETLGGHHAEVARALLDDSEASNGFKPVAASGQARGANLIGYAFGEFGMGEHVRMVARALSHTDTAFGILDQQAGLHGVGDHSVKDWVTDITSYGTNIFHVNADVFPTLYFKFGAEFFETRYNIGYWAWELAACPPEFDLALNIVDEVWAISEFVAESFRTRAKVPVVSMPLAVTVPELDASLYSKAYFGLPEHFTYFFVFDAASYLDRKNPIAAVRAFRQAFPTGKEKVQFVLKTMNIELGGELWAQLLAEIGDDKRFIILSKRLTREEVFGLYLACDVFVSLHRCEGFGRCVAEAMAYGKPVISTNYSGTLDFAFEGTACVVDYTLIPVPEGAYPFAKGQVWADPDVDQAAQYMQRLYRDKAYLAKIAAAGQAHILTHFNETVIGETYAKRLAEVEALKAARPKTAHLKPQGDDEIIGSVDSPTPEEASGISDILSVQGWVASRAGIARLELFIDGAVAGDPHYGLLRADVRDGHPEMKDAGKSGFFFQADVTQLKKGLHQARLVAHSESGQTRTWDFDFTCIGSVRYDQWLSQRALVAPAGTASSALRVAVAVMTCDTTTAAALKASLRALESQTFAPHDVVIVGPRVADVEASVRWVEGGTSVWATLAEAVSDADVVIPIDAGDVLTPDAVSTLTTAHAARKTVDLAYADEDMLSGDLRSRPRFKPGWSPRFLAHNNYVGKPWSVRTRLFKDIVASSTDPSEHQLLNLLGAKASGVAHVPDVLCSRPFRAQTAPKASISTETARDKVLPKVSVIIPTCLHKLDLVERCFDGLLKSTDYPDMEVIIVANNLSDPAAAKAFLARWPFTVVYWEGAFNWSALNNAGTHAATGDRLLYLNDDIEPLEGQWLRRLVETLDDHEAGIVGPMLRYPNQTLQHLGLNLIDYGGGARHLFRFNSGREDHLQWIMAHPREVSAVTGACLLTTRAVYEAVGGFDETLMIVCNDIDFCLKASEAGYALMIEPRAELTHYEGVSRAGLSESADVKRFWKRWGARLKAGDTFTHPGLDKLRDDWMVDPALAKPFGPRITETKLQAASAPRRAAAKTAKG